MKKNILISFLFLILLGGVTYSLIKEKSFAAFTYPGTTSTTTTQTVATPAPTPSPSPSPTLTPTPTPTMPPTPTPSATPTATPTATPSPSATPSATPSPSPTPTPKCKDIVPNNPGDCDAGICIGLGDCKELNGACTCLEECSSVIGENGMCGPGICNGVVEKNCRVYISSGVTFCTCAKPCENAELVNGRCPQGICKTQLLLCIDDPADTNKCKCPKPCGEVKPNDPGSCNAGRCDNPPGGSCNEFNGDCVCVEECRDTKPQNGTCGPGICSDGVINCRTNGLYYCSCVGPCDEKTPNNGSCGQGICQGVERDCVALPDAMGVLRCGCNIRCEGLPLNSCTVGICTIMSGDILSDCAVYENADGDPECSCPKKCALVTPTTNGECSQGLCGDNVFSDCVKYKSAANVEYCTCPEECGSILNLQNCKKGLCNVTGGPEELELGDCVKYTNISDPYNPFQYCSCAEECRDILDHINCMQGLCSDPSAPGNPILTSCHIEDTNGNGMIDILEPCVCDTLPLLTPATTSPSSPTPPPEPAATPTEPTTDPSLFSPVPSTDPSSLYDPSTGEILLLPH